MSPRKVRTVLEGDATVAVARLSRDLAKTARDIDREEARVLVDAYYQIQENRKRATSQSTQLEKSHEPHELVTWMQEQLEVFESQIARALDKYSSSHPVGIWARDQVGIGPVIAAGLLAHVDITKSNTAGKLWAFAGLDPTKTWGKGQRRPWNAALKVLCWKIGESFVKTSSVEDSYYGPLYAARKALEIRNNLDGKLVDQAIKRSAGNFFGADTEAILWYTGCLTPDDARTYYATPAESRLGLAKRLAGAPGSGMPMLAPAHIHARAKRWVVKLFLAHFHQIYYEHHYGEKPPAPYPIAHMGHVDMTPPPV